MNKSLSSFLDRSSLYLSLPPSTPRVFLTTVVFFLIYAVCLNYHETLYATAIGVDDIIFLDGITRVLHGHVPHRDFSGGLGLLNFYGSALLRPFSKTIFQAFLYYHTVVLAFFLVISCYLSITRLQRFTAFVLIMYVAAMIATPLGINSDVNVITHASFYNRFGWTANLVGFLFLLMPRNKSTLLECIDAFLVSLLLLFLLYTKITDFLVLSALYTFVLFLYPQRFIKLAVMVFITSTIGILLVEWMIPGIHWAYADDLLSVSMVSGGVDLDFLKYASRERWYILACIFAFYLVRNIYNDNAVYNKKLHYILASFMTLGALFVLANNTQPRGAISLLAIIIVLASIYFSACTAKTDNETRNNRLLLMALILLFIYPEISIRHKTIIQYFNETKKTEYAFPIPEGMKGLYFSEGNANLLQHLVKSEGNLTIQQYRDLSPIESRKKQIYLSEYAYSIAQGTLELQSVMAQYGTGSIINLDYANPFSAFLDLEPVKGDAICYHTMRASYKPAEVLFAEAKYIAVPKFAAMKVTTDFLFNLYRDHITGNYRIVSDSQLWTFYLKK